MSPNEIWLWSSERTRCSGEALVQLQATECKTLPKGWPTVVGRIGSSSCTLFMRMWCNGSHAGLRSQCREGVKVRVLSSVPSLGCSLMEHVRDIGLPGPRRYLGKIAHVGACSGDSRRRPKAFMARYASSGIAAPRKPMRVVSFLGGVRRVRSLPGPPSLRMLTSGKLPRCLREMRRVQFSSCAPRRLAGRADNSTSSKLRGCARLSTSGTGSRYGSRLFADTTKNLLGWGHAR